MANFLHQFREKVIPPLKKVGSGIASRIDQRQKEEQEKRQARYERSRDALSLEDDDVRGISTAMHAKVATAFLGIKDQRTLAKTVIDRDKLDAQEVQTFFTKNTKQRQHMWRAESPYDINFPHTKRKERRLGEEIYGKLRSDIPTLYKLMNFLKGVKNLSEVEFMINVLLSRGENVLESIEDLSRFDGLISHVHDWGKRHELCEILASYGLDLEIAETIGEKVRERKWRSSRLIKLAEPLWKGDMKALGEIIDIAACFKNIITPGADGDLNNEHVFSHFFYDEKEIRRLCKFGYKRSQFLRFTDPEMLKTFIDYARSLKSDEQRHAFVDLEGAYGGDLERMKMVRDFLDSKEINREEEEILLLHGGKYNFSRENFEENYRMIREGFDQVSDRIIEMLIYNKKGERAANKFDDIKNIWAEIKPIIGNLTSEQRKIVIEVGYFTSTEELEAVTKIIEKGGKTDDIRLAFKLWRESGEGIDVTELRIVWGKLVAIVEPLGEGQKTTFYRYANKLCQNIEQVEYVIMLISEGRGSTLDGLQAMQHEYGADVEMMKICAAYYKFTGFYDQNTLHQYIAKFRSGGDEAAREYLNSLRERAKALIGPEIPVEARKEPEYGFYTRYVFPSGNYSDHEKNIACGDRMRHISRYKFNKGGYPAVMTGLLGYRLTCDEDGKPLKEENEELLSGYQGRLENIRKFVSSRGPNNEALRKAFEQKVSVKFDALPTRWDKIKNRKKNTLKEKLLAIFLEEAVKRHYAKDSKPDPEVLDLLVEFKYAFNEELEGYIRRTADETDRFKDPVSQRFNLWRELSVIYGENMKHVLRHDIFESFAQDSEYRGEIETTFSEAIADANIAFSLSDKQKERITSTFTNPHIPGNKKLDILKKQVLMIYGNNLKYSSDDARRQFENDIQIAMASCEETGNLPAEYFFQEIAPRLESIRLQYALNISGVLEDIFTTDINLINQEIAKYEEVVETEMKETRMYGPKEKTVEKKMKKRNIRGYITKTRETANARMGAYLCIAGDKGMWENPNYFELVLKDEDTGKCVGVVMLLNIEAEDGKKYLWFGPNPFESFVGQVSSEQCYSYMHQTVCNFAQENGFDGVVIPAQEGQILGACTNRGGDFPDLIKQSRLFDAKGKVRVVQYGKQHKLSGSYSFSDGALVWERKGGKK